MYLNEIYGSVHLDKYWSDMFISMNGLGQADVLSPYHFKFVTSLVVWWSHLLTPNHEVPNSIPGSTMGIFPCRGRIPVVTMVWVVSRIRLKVETSVTRSHTSINS